MTQNRKSVSCEEARAGMVLALYGELPGEDSSLLEAHTAECEACRAEFAGLSEAREAVSALPEEPLSARVAEEIRVSAREALGRKPAAVFFGKRIMKPAFALAVLLAVLSVFLPGKRQVYSPEDIMLPYYSEYAELEQEISRLEEESGELMLNLTSELVNTYY